MSTITLLDMDDEILFLIIGNIYNTYVGKRWLDVKSGSHYFGSVSSFPREIQSICHCMATCKILRNIASSDDIWKSVYQNFFCSIPATNPWLETCLNLYTTSCMKKHICYTNSVTMCHVNKYEKSWSDCGCRWMAQIFNYDPFDTLWWNFKIEDIIIGSNNYNILSKINDLLSEKTIILGNLELSEDHQMDTFRRMMEFAINDKIQIEKITLWKWWEISNRPCLHLNHYCEESHFVSFKKHINDGLQTWRKDFIIDMSEQIIKKRIIRDSQRKKMIIWLPANNEAQIVDQYENVIDMSKSFIKKKWMMPSMVIESKLKKGWSVCLHQNYPTTVDQQNYHLISPKEFKQNFKKVKHSELNYYQAKRAAILRELEELDNDERIIMKQVKHRNNIYDKCIISSEMIN